jgi:hypothetical protein
MYLPKKKKQGASARSGITTERERLFNAHSKRMRLARASGTKKSPDRDMTHSFAGLMTIEA